MERRGRLCAKCSTNAWRAQPACSMPAACATLALRYGSSGTQRVTVQSTASRTHAVAGTLHEECHQMRVAAITPVAETSVRKRSFASILPEPVVLLLIRHVTAGIITTSLGLVTVV